ncbi:hypothetical protein LCGC14_2272880 [marine sediment metagenome]|uniref:Uncharacterized protein n=1 Tax=marine sediment metagenome TaxID=412755 RepID=A0A0F9CWK4_9ZZZZ
MKIKNIDGALGAEKEYYYEETNNLEVFDEFERSMESLYETMGEANIGGYNEARKTFGEVDLVGDEDLLKNAIRFYTGEFGVDEETVNALATRIANAFPIKVKNEDT